MPGRWSRRLHLTATTTRRRAAASHRPRSLPVSEATLAESTAPDEHGAAMEHVPPEDPAAHDAHGHAVTTTGLSNNKLAMWLFLGSECLLFGGLISTYMLYRGRHTGSPGPAQLW